MTKPRLKVYTAKTVNVVQQTEKVTCEKVLTSEQSYDPYSCYGKEMSNCIPGLPHHWKTSGLDLSAMTHIRGLPGVVSMHSYIFIYSPAVLCRLSPGTLHF